MSGERRSAVTGDMAFEGSVDDRAGLGVSVYQERDSIRLEIGDTVANLRITSVNGLIRALRDAAIDARLWELGQDEADEDTAAYVDGETLPPGAQDAGWAAYWSGKTGFRDGQ